MNPYEQGYCLVRYVPPKLATKIYKACLKAKPNAGVILAPPSKGSWPSIWAVKRHGLVKVVNEFALEIERAETADLRRRD